MALTTSLQTVNIVRQQDDVPVTSAGSTGVPYAIQNANIDYVTAATAAQAVSFPGAVSQISVRYYRNNQQLTGTYLVTQTVANILTAANGYLQSLHVLQLSNGTAAPLNQSTGTVYLFPNSTFLKATAANAKYVALYPNAATQIEKVYYSNAARFTGTLIVTEALSAVVTAS